MEITSIKGAIKRRGVLSSKEKVAGVNREMAIGWTIMGFIFIGFVLVRLFA